MIDVTKMRLVKAEVEAAEEQATRLAVQVARLFPSEVQLITHYGVGSEPQGDTIDAWVLALQHAAETVDYLAKLRAVVVESDVEPSPMNRA